MTDKSNKEVYIQDDEIDLGALFKTIFDYKYIVIGITLVFVVLGVFYASMQTRWFKTIAVVEVGHTMVNNEKNYITSYNKFSNDVLSLGVSVIDDENTVFKSISVDNNVTLDDEDILMLGNGFYAISLVGSDKDASTSEINKIIDSVILEHKIDLEYAMREKEIALDLLRQDINRTENILLTDANYQLETINKEAPMIEEKINQITEILVNQNTKDISSTYNTQIGSSDYGLSSLIQYRDSMIRGSISGINTKIFELKTSLANKKNQFFHIEEDIKDGFVNTEIKSIATVSMPNKNMLIVVALTMVGFFTGIFSALAYGMVKNTIER